MKQKKEKPNLYTQEKKGFTSKLIKFLIRVLFGKYTFHFHGKQPEKPSVFVANHTYNVGPLIMQYQYPGNIRTWSNSKFYTKEECFPYMKEKFVDSKPKRNRFLEFIIKINTPMTVWFYRKKLNVIPVYHDFGIAKTLRLTSNTLTNESNIAIYPEQFDSNFKGVDFNGVICKFNTGFVYLAQTHYNLTGECLDFYPIYIAQTLKQVHFGEPIKYNPEIPMSEQIPTIIQYLEEKVVELHDMLPPHKVITISKETTKSEETDKNDSSQSSEIDGNTENS